MIKQIQNSEYLKRFDNMDAMEQKEFLGRVGEWCEKHAPALFRHSGEAAAQFQDVIQCSASWNDGDCHVFEEGARLLSALMSVSDTWLPKMLYIKSAKRSIRRMNDILSELAKNEKYKETIMANGRQVLMDGHEERTHEAKQAPSIVDTRSSAIDSSKAVLRPKHIDQYVHLLPQKTQERAATVKGLLRNLDVARENARLLMNDPNAKSDDIARWAKTATAIDDKLKAIYSELDSEWEKLVKSGWVFVDDLGNARIAVHASYPVTEEKEEPENAESEKVAETAENETAKKRGRPALSEAEKADRASERAERLKEERAAEKAKRIRSLKPKSERALRKAVGKLAEEEKASRREYLKKWLRDTRTSKSPEHDIQWTDNVRELQLLGVELTESIKRAGEFYGLNIEEMTINQQTEE